MEIDAPNSPAAAPAAAETRPQHVVQCPSSRISKKVAARGRFWERERLPIWPDILPSQPPRLQMLGRRSTIFDPSPCLLTIKADRLPNLEISSPRSRDALQAFLLPVVLNTALEAPRMHAMVAEKAPAKSATHGRDFRPKPRSRRKLGPRMTDIPRTAAPV